MTSPWKRSTRCGNTACVEVHITDTAVKVRDSKQGDDSPVLDFTVAEWQAFVAGAKAGEFDA